MAYPVRVRAKSKPAQTSRPLIVSLAMRVRALARVGVILALRLPPGRFRRVVGEWAMREVVLGSLTRRDYPMIKKFSTADVELIPAPELVALLHQRHPPVLRGVDAFQRFFENWLEEWGAFRIVPKEGIDLGDGRVLALNHIQGRGASSGIEIHQEEAELYEARRGLMSRSQQWWSWHEALEAVGMGE